MKRINRIRQNVSLVPAAKQAESGAPEATETAEKNLCEMARRWPPEFALLYFEKRPILGRLGRKMARAFLDAQPLPKSVKRRSPAWQRKKAREIGKIDTQTEAERALVKRLTEALNATAAVLDILSGKALCVRLAVSAPKNPFLN